MDATGEGVAFRAPERFAVDGDVFEAEGLAQFVHPTAETRGEDLGIQSAEDSINRIVARDAIGQFEEALEPVLPPFGKGFDRLEGLGSANHGTQGDHQNVIEPMLAGPHHAGIGQFGKMLGERPAGHARILQDSRTIAERVISR